MSKSSSTEDQRNRTLASTINDNDPSNKSGDNNRNKSTEKPPVPVRKTTDVTASTEPEPNSAPTSLSSLANGAYAEGQPRVLSSKRRGALTLLQRLNTSQKVQLVSGQDLWHTKPVPHLDLPAIMLSDGPHGLRKQEGTEHSGVLGNRVPSTCFPTASALACTWNTQLLVEMGKALRDEAVAEHVTVLLGPGMNLQRHPCGGRNFEYFSEDPYLSGTMAAALVEGIQSSGQVGASVKHFAVNNQERWRYNLDAIVDERTLRELYLRAFEICIVDKPKELQPWTVMCSYNQVNGSYASESEYLNDQVLRKEWKFDGLTMTDWGATNIRWKGIAAGMDLEMPGSHGANDHLTMEAIKNGDLSESALDQCALRVLELILMGQELQAQNQCSKDKKRSLLLRNHELSHQVALETSVLLKNENNLLPIRFPHKHRHHKRLAIIGNFAKFPRYQGMGSSQVLAYQCDNALDAFARALGCGTESESLVAGSMSNGNEAITESTFSRAGCPNTILFSAGYNDHADGEDEASTQLRSKAVEVAKEADVTLLFVGLPESYESEAFDRPTMDLPPSHVKLIRQVSEAVGSSKVVVILTNGSAVAIEPWIDCAGAVLDVWLNGQAGGRAICDLVMGNANPSGKLAQTMPLRMTDVPSDSWFPGVDHQVQHREGLNVGYRFYETAQQPVLFPFGYGLSYTTFQYSSMKVQREKTSTNITVTLKVKNMGSVAGKESVQCYVHANDSKVYRPELELKAFCKTRLLGPGEEEILTMKLDRKSFAFWDIGHEDWTVEPGSYELRIGASARDIRLRQNVFFSGSKSTQEATERARQTHPPLAKGQRLPSMMDVTEQDFLRSMELTNIPPAPYAEGERINLNSLLEDIQHTTLGRMLMDSILKEMQRDQEESFEAYSAPHETPEFLIHETQSQSARVVEHTVAVMQPPLPQESLLKIERALAGGAAMRSLVLFSRGILTFEMMEWLIQSANNPCGSALLTAPWVLLRFGVHNTCRERHPVVK